MKLHKRLLPQYSTNRVKVYALPQTEAIRIVGVKFTGAGHSNVYKEIPDGEVWVAEELWKVPVGMKIPEGKFYLLHELYEFDKMAKGMSYDDAHLLSNKIEGKARAADEKYLDEAIKREMSKLKDMIYERSHFNGTLNLHKDGMMHHAHSKRMQRTEPSKRIISIK